MLKQKPQCERGGNGACLIWNCEHDYCQLVAIEASVPQSYL